MWLLHNVVSHPIMGILDLLGFDSAATFVHDITLPQVDQGPNFIPVFEGSESVGQDFTELLTLARGRVEIKRKVDNSGNEDIERPQWVVSYQVRDIWRQSRSNSLTEALRDAIDGCLRELEVE